ncbi:MAG: tRNA-2-methylthio-N(6)-dimethylallyladenosine synthase [Alphaproteobacteria bacterium MarineAlpha5_Bin9]|nr:MAG: tRNA-2-methylthio-N(6)-dimethylallyladenosine synthase [Alphaproteobacteria bacterium MarineAlpha5_Bin9]|tara:strand:+ start:2297 stop:3613 length:1317 start_codon:yes stop_codon:yes gene_type:complete
MTEKKFFIKSYGCQMNVYDSNQIKNLLLNEGYNEALLEKDADLIVLNTCHIREKASEKVHSDIGRINKLKKTMSQNKNYSLVLAGCVAQAEGEEFKKRSPSIDYIVGPQSYHKLPDMINKNEYNIADDFLQNDKFNNLVFKNSNTVSEFISVQEGCDKFCTFCVVPYTRGSEYSRSIDDILNEIKIYMQSGIQEIILLGQNVNAFHGINSIGKEVDLSFLINKIAELEKIKRIRYMTSHPIDMTDSLMKCHRDNEKLMPFLHLPIQSGSDHILKKMNRKHTVQEYYKVIEKLKGYRSDMALSSDFIVGFPGETDEDFDKTMRFIENIKFVIAYSFIYSPRPGTPAAKLEQISNPIKKARLAALQSLLKKQQKEYNDSFLNKKIEILFEKKGRYKNQYIGRSIYNQSVHVKSNLNLIGSLKKVKISSNTNFSLEGKMYE